MKLKLFPTVVAPIAAIAVIATSSVSVTADTTRDEKRSAEAYWADFKQDSKQSWKDSKEAFHDGWIESKLETAFVLNKYLSPYEIDIRVDNNKATLNGEVYSSVDKELAGNIALGIEGIDSVANNITVVQKPANTTVNARKNNDRNFSQYIDDVSKTAAIKTELLASDNIKGLAINVDTYNDTVTLSGNVQSGEQKDLAEAIAAKHDGVKHVVNKLQIKS